MILQSLSDLQRQGSCRINYQQDEKANGAYGSRLHGGHMSDRDDTVRDGRLLDTLERIRDRHMYYASSDSDRH